MALLIDRTDIQKFRQLSNTLHDDTLNQQITDAQFVDVQELMGSDFYNDLVLNPATPENVALLDGGSYIFQTITYTNHGLKAVISHYAYARYVLFGSVNDTPFSMVEKLSGADSQPIDIGTKRTIYKNNQQTAFKYWANVVDFLNRNADDYPLWKNNCQRNRGDFRISKIDGESRRNISPRFRLNRF